MHCLDPEDAAPNGDAPHGKVDVAEHAGYLAAYSSLIKAPLCFTSAATGTGVTELFQRLVHDCAVAIPPGKECEAQGGACSCDATVQRQHHSAGTTQPVLPGVPLVAYPASQSDLQMPLLPPSPSVESERGVRWTLQRWCCCGQSYAPS